MVLFLMLKVSFESFAEEFCHLELDCQVDSVVATIDRVPVLVFVMIRLQLRLFIDVAFLNVHSQLEIDVIIKMQKRFVTVLCG